MYKLGIICANFGYPYGRFPLCEAAWCADCFTPHDMDCFEIKMPGDFYGVDLTEEEDAHCFLKARAGDHLCSVFQCSNCQSQNIR